MTKFAGAELFPLAHLFISNRKELITDGDGFMYHLINPEKVYMDKQEVNKKSKAWKGFLLIRRHWLESSILTIASFYQSFLYFLFREEVFSVFEKV